MLTFGYVQNIYKRQRYPLLVISRASFFNVKQAWQIFLHFSTLLYSTVAEVRSENSRSPGLSTDRATESPSALLGNDGKI